MLSLVAERDGKIVGHIFFSPAEIEEHGETIKEPQLSESLKLSESSDQRRIAAGSNCQGFLDGSRRRFKITLMQGLFNPLHLPLPRRHTTSSQLSLLPRFRPMPRHKSPTAGAEQKSEIIPAARIVDGVNGNIILKQACHETDGGDKPVQQAVPESVLLSGQACLYGFDTGTGNKKAAGEEGRGCQ
jgi:hypothetical protein